LRGFNKRFDPIVRWLMYIAGAVLFLYVCFMFLDVFLRYLFNKPIPYDVDITQEILSLLCFFSVGYAQLMKGHVCVDLFTGRLKPRAALTLSTAMYIVCVVLTGVMVWQGVLNAMHYYHAGIITYGGLPLFPASVIMPFGLVFLCIVFIRDLFNKFVECRQNHFGVVRWLLMVVLPVAFLVITALGMYQVFKPISSFSAGIWTLVLLFVLIFLGMPIGFALFTVAVILMGYVSGPKPGFMAMGPTLFTHVTSYTWIVIPLYILMSYFILVGGLGTAAFWGCYKWIGHIRGGLAMAVVAGSTALAAVVGTGTAATVTMGLIAFPEMRKYKYADSLATGCVAAGATLGPIIPPSLPFIVYGILTETSIGALFIAGVIPGVLLAVSFVAVILVAVRIKPELGPAAPKTPWGERIRSIPVFGPIVLLFLIVIGGIYAGIFTVMEGGGIGAFGSLMIALASRKNNWKNFKEAHTETMKFVGMVFVMVVGSVIIGNSLGASGVSAWIGKLCVESGLSGVTIVVILLIVYMLFGLVADAPVIIMLTIPVLWSMLEQMGVDLIWFGVLGALVGGLGGISPPYAMGIFVLRAIACPDVPLGTMFRGILPFCLSTIVVAALVVAFPSLATWLPTVMR
jgi:tripartite ATP-independent transporter DctM subunit